MLAPFFYAKFHRYKVSVYNDAAHLNRQVFFRKLAY